MEAKDKAKELIDKMTFETHSYNAKQCALVAVDELINDCSASSPFEAERLYYWNEVKNEINKL